VTSLRCIAYLEDGRICGQFAPFIDHEKGGSVCAAHRARGAGTGRICATCWGSGRRVLDPSLPWIDAPVCEDCNGEGRGPGKEAG